MVALVSDTLKVIVRHVASLFPYFALELLPVSFKTVPIRISPPVVVATETPERRICSEDEMHPIS